jgi:WD40 repeat protein
MAQQLQESQPEKKKQTYKQRSWVLWTVVLIVLCVIFAFTITVLLILKSQGINQGTVTILTVLSIIVGTVVALLGLLFTFLQWFHSRPSHPSEPLPLSIVPHHNEAPNNVNLSKSIPINMHQEDWGEAPSIWQFYGREQDRAELKQWIVDDHCRMVAVLGIGGIGKTSLTAVVAEQVKDEFDGVFWRSLQNAPPPESLLRSCIQFFSHQQQVDSPEDVDSQVTLLIQYLREHRGLLIFDNFETVLQAGDRVGHYREGYEGYSRLLQRVGEARHQSCLILTSREKPQEVSFLEGDLTLVRSRELEGLKFFDGREIMKDKGLRGEEKNWESLVLRYKGNPLALKIVAQFIREVFDGDIAGFLETGEEMFSTIRHVLEQQFSRLSALELAIMYWLAIEREAMSLDELDEDLMQPVSRRALLEAIESLRRRSMIEVNGLAHFTLQPVIMEYVIDELAGQVYQEIAIGTIALLASHSLMKSQAKDYIRDSQVTLVLTPVVERLLSTFGEEGSEKKLKNILTALRETQSQKHGYAAGNVLNLLIHLQCDLEGYDFSHQMIRQAYLQGIVLPRVNFTYANFATTVFTDTFGSVNSIAFSPNGELVAAGTADGEVHVWQVSSGKPFLTCDAHSNWVYSIAFSPDGSNLACGSDNQTIHVWDVNSRQALTFLQGPGYRTMTVAFSPDGNLLASGSDDHAVILWDIHSGQALKTLQGHAGPVRSVAFSPDGSILASGSEDWTVNLWDIHSGKVLKTLKGHVNQVRSVALSPDGNILASGSTDQTICLWDVHSGQVLKTLQGHTNWVRSVAFSPNGNILASGSADQTIRLWDVHSGGTLQILQSSASWIKAVAFGPDGNLLASGSDDNTVRLWEVQSGKVLKTLQGYINRAWSVAFSPDGKILVSGNEDQKVQLWDVHSGQVLKTLRGHTNRVISVAFSPAGNLLASGSDDLSIQVWDTRSGQLINTLQGHINRVRSVAFSPDGNILASGSQDQTVHLWDVHTGQVLKTLKAHSHWIWSVAFSPDGNILASGDNGQIVCLWDVHSGQVLKILQGHVGPIRSISFSPDGNTLVSGSKDRLLLLWDVHSGQVLKTLHGHTNRIWSVAFGPSGNILASGSDDQTVRLWDVRSGQELKTLQGHTNRVLSVAFSPDGNILASSSDDGTIMFWDVQTGVYLKTLRVDRPYEQMNISGVKGLTEAQKATLKALGAVEDEMQALS